MIKVLTTRPFDWDNRQTENLTVRCVEVGSELRNGSTILDGIGTCLTKQRKKNLVNTFEEFKPDYFLFVVHFGLFTLQFLKHLKKISPRTKFVHWSGNQVLNENKLCWYTDQMKSEIDYVFTNTTDKERIGLIEKKIPKGVFTLYDFGFDPDLFEAPKSEPEIDCFFGGGTTVSKKLPNGRFPFSKIRQEIMVKVNKDYNSEIRGGNWPFESKHGLHGLDYFQAMQRAKIVLGTYHLDLERYYTKRTIYAGASGRPYLVRYIPGMENDFENHENILWYHSKDECFDVLNYYLKDDLERQIIGDNQRMQFVLNHSWDARLNDLDKLIMEIENK